MNIYFYLTTNQLFDLEKIKKPSLYLFLTEIARALRELWQVLPFIKNYQVEKKSDGHTVFVIPGFLASDFSTKPLRRFLTRLGYITCGWELGRNLADVNQLPILAKKIDYLYQKSGRKISLIGWSLGGVYARQLAKEKKDKVRQVITLGSPFRDILAPNNAVFTFNIIKWLKGYPEPDPVFLEDLPKPVPLPSTAIYSKKDGIVPWQACMEIEEDAIHQNIEVNTSHLGMGTQKDVLKIIANRLQYTVENWVKYE